MLLKGITPKGFKHECRSSKNAQHRKTACNKDVIMEADMVLIFTFG